jgi:calcineurin-like phosphoesterase family protein
LLVLILFISQTDSTQSSAISTQFNIAAVGDWACNNDTRSTVKNIVTEKPELVLALGDLSYQRDPDCWFDIISPIDNITTIARGDHDNDHRMNSYKEHFNMTSEFYSFNRERIHFLVMSTETPYELNSEQYKFVTNDLENASTDSNILWIVVAYHQPAYTSPTNCKGCSPRVMLRDVYHPIFDMYGVDLVLQAHDHNYERSYPILYNKEDSGNPLIVNENKNNYNYSTSSPHGIIFATVGTGGGELNIFEGKASYMVKQYRGFGFLDIEVMENGMKLSGRFVANDATIVDYFNIYK